MTVVGAATTAAIPDAFRDLADCPRVAALTTVGADGYPQTSVVWCDLEPGRDGGARGDGDVVRINTMAGFAKVRNMRREPRVTLLCYDPAEPLRSLEVRGTVIDMTEEGAAAQLDAIASKYMGRPVRYFGDCIPVRFAETEQPLLCRIRPARIVARDWRGGGGVGMNAHPILGRLVPEPPPRPAPDAATRPTSRPDVAVPASHVDMLMRPIVGVLTTLFGNGQPHSTLVWVGFDGDCATVNTTLERWPGRNLASNPKASLLVVDPDDTARYMQIRGDVELVEDHAVEHLDALTRRYTRHPRFYGCLYPEGQRALDHRVICRLHARRVTLDAIHA